MLHEFFESEKIECYAVLSYSDVREINTRLREGCGFEPKSVIIYLLPYYAGATENLSVYAASLDYHIVIRGISERLGGYLSDIFPKASYRGFGDHSPIDECSAALSAGLGIRGDNGLIINEKYGSYVFIGDMITDIEPDRLGAVQPKDIGECHHCGACRAACPTGILRGEGCDCLSAITQRKGELTENEAALMKKINTVWGCDICQSICPYNREPQITPIEFFHRERIPCLSSDILDTMGKEEFTSRAFAWRGRKTVERNLKLLGY
ncbi:MAG: epoxyqueuosine reductase [Clostridia bacterium]|nr:epoxyqueuosine reductase [Clostridia bacterium]